MAIHKRPSRKGGFNYQVIVDYEPGAGGKRRRRVVGSFQTKRQAEIAETRAKEERNRGFDMPEGGLTIAKMAHRFLEAVANDLAGQTASRYAEHLFLHVVPTVGGIAAHKLRRAHLVDLYANLRSQGIEYRKRRPDGSEKVRHGAPLGKTTVLRVHRVVHRML